MLAEYIITKKDVIPGQITEHCIRPVKHWGLDKDQIFSVPDREFIAGLNRFKIQLLVIMTLNRFYAVFGAVNRSPANDFQ